MTATIKVLLVSEVRTAKNGKTYRKVLYMISLDGMNM